jgi:phospholipase C
MMQENRTFDSYFGMLNPYRETNQLNTGADGVVYTVDGIDDKLDEFSDSNDQGTSFKLFKFTSTCIDDDTSAWEESYGDVNKFDFRALPPPGRPINENGFVHIAADFATSGSGNGQFTDVIGQRAMGYYDQTFLNYYYFMASEFALSDRWFSPVASKTVPNRIATMSGGTTQGLVRDPEHDDHLGDLDIETIFEELDNANVPWKIYYTVTDNNCLASDDDCDSEKGSFPATTFSDFSYSTRYLSENPTGTCTPPQVGSKAVGDASNSFCIDTAHIAPLSQFFTDSQNNTLPSYAFIEAGYGVNDEHPGSGQSILNGQAEVASILNAFMASSSWQDSVFFLSFDEGGGPFDHVPPVPGHTNDFTDASLGVTTDISSIAVNPDTDAAGAPIFLPCLAPGGVANAHCDLQPGEPGTNPDDAPAPPRGFSAQLGFRLPNMIVSPFTRAHYVSHTPMDHTAIIKFVESRFIGPNAHLTNRDAAQPNLLEFFDFVNVPWATPPTPPAPVTPSSLGFDPCTPAKFAP